MLPEPEVDAAGIVKRLCSQPRAGKAEMASKSIMVTGGCGFVGAALVARLVGSGADVVVLDDQRLGSPANVAVRVAQDVTFVPTNLEDATETRRVLEEHAPRVIYHLAAIHFIPACNRNPYAAVSSNVSGTQSLLDACMGLDSIEALVVASSAAVYAPAPGPHRENDPTQPTDIYGLTKLWNEHQARLFHNDRDGSVGVGVARLFNVFGPGETNEHLIPAVIGQALAGGPLQLGNLDTRRDYVYVDDVAAALEKLAEAVAGGGIETCNVGGEVGRDGRQIIQTISEILGRELVVEIDQSRLRASDRPALVSDCTRARGTLDWSVETGFKKGLEKALELPLAPKSAADAAALVS